MSLFERIDIYTNNYIHCNEQFFQLVNELTSFHFYNCEEYKSILNKIFGIDLDKQRIKHLSHIPYLHVDLFKNYELKSIDNSQIFKTLTSSGTSGQRTSKIFLNRQNARIQSIALSKIFTDFTGLKRPRILILDSPELLRNNENFSARSAGIRGFSSLCRKPLFALKSDMSINHQVFEDLLLIEDEQILLYGFTFIIWLHFLKNEIPKKIKNILARRGVLIHGGGWKKLKNLNISKEEFKDKVTQITGIKKIINYYGMVEQTGSIFMECGHGFLHSNALGNILSRSIDSLQNNQIGEVGIAQIISCLPLSYPGHSLLTDDLIKINSIDNCKCGRRGTAFEFIERIKKSESRGCSDTYDNKK